MALRSCHCCGTQPQSRSESRAVLEDVKDTSCPSPCIRKAACRTEGVSWRCRVSSPLRVIRTHGINGCLTLAFASFSIIGLSRAVQHRRRRPSSGRSVPSWAETLNQELERASTVKRPIETFVCMALRETNSGILRCLRCSRGCFRGQLCCSLLQSTSEPHR